MPLKVETPATAAPVDLAELKAHLNLEGVDRFDGFLELCISASRGPAEYELGLTLVEKELAWTIGQWKQKVELPRPPLKSLTKVEYRADDASGTWTEVDASNYEVNSDASPGFVKFSSDYDAPDTYEDEEYPWRFTYSAGYGAGPEAVPVEIRLMLMNAIGTQFMKRESTVISNGSVDVKYLERAMGRLIRPHNKRKSFG